MHSPPVQPSARMRSGAGAVTTMSLVIATIARESSGMPAAQAFVAMTSRSRRDATRASVRIRTGPPRDRTTGRACSRRSARRPRAPPAAARARAPPAARSPRSSSSTPARWTAEPERRAISSGASLRNGPDAEPLAERDDALPRAHLRRRRRGPQPAGLAEVRVDPVRLAEAPDLVDRRLRSARDAHGVRRAAERDERGELRPPGEHEAAVSAGRAAAADVLLEHDDVAATARAA